ncbi:MAG: dnaA, partial [Chloroflexi bacterium]|nr:dnaA [Chloroflexota bacterium]
GATCVVGVRNPLVVQWLTSKCTTLVGRTMESLLGTPVGVQFIVGGAEPAPDPIPTLSMSRPEGRRASRPSRRGARSATDEVTRPAISARYVFENFVVGKNNELAHAAAVAVAGRPGTVHNPLFIFGGVGLGKTHLLHAIGHAGLSSGLEVVYVSSETFTNNFIESISRGRMEEFRARYRRSHILLIDDIQFIAGKEQTQEEFFHTFNAVHEANGQIVITSDRHPRAITTLEDRLRSRFVWGLMVDIQPPDLETRAAILLAKVAEACRNGNLVDVPSEVLEFIAAKVPSNVRELEGTLNRVLAYAELVHAPVTLELAATALDEVLAPRGQRSVAPESVVKAVCRAMGVTRQDLESKKRDRRVVVPRQIAMYLLRQETELSLSEVGALFGGRDHSTVLHSYEKVSQDVERNDRVRNTVRAIRELLAHSA